MVDLLEYLSQLPTPILWLIFLTENVAITLGVLIVGGMLQQKFRSPQTNSYHYIKREVLLCILTNILNTVVTYAGFWLWKEDIIKISFTGWLYIIPDFIILFMAMDLLMYIFHFIIHKTFLYNAIHQLHHQAVDPKPIDLFVLHPIETLCFGSLWLIVLMAHAFNIYSIVAYLTINVVFGLVGHLGLEPLPEKLRSSFFLKYIGTSTFHHEHHQDVEHNFGFYTNIWDRLFGTHSK
jgi:sterol desaturase/sphingolipid hydroxylase (fatty acid hydroxylase superfamily)